MKPTPSLFVALTIVLVTALSSLAGADSVQQTHDRLSFATDWQQASSPEFKNFRQWADRYLAAPNAGSRRALLSEGVALAEKRKFALLALIHSNPRAALALAVPMAVRDGLPAAIQGLLEMRIEGQGDFLVTAATPAPGLPARSGLFWTVKIDGATYHAYVYGRRLFQTSKYRIPLGGIAVDDQLALAESPLRLLEPGEATPAGAKPIVWTQATTGSPGSSVAVKAGSQIYTLAREADVAPLEAALVRNESGLGPFVSNVTGVPGQGSARATKAIAYTLGNKQVLVIRVDFSDLPGVPASNGTGTPSLTTTLAQSIMDMQVNPYYTLSSFNQTSLTTTVATNLYRMPHPASYYATGDLNDALHSDAENLAAADYTLANYDRIIVDFANLSSLTNSQITYGGLGDIGASRIWINGYFDASVLQHELGHTYGLYHSDLWLVTDGNPVSAAGTSIDYGDPFDVMGSGTAVCQFNPWDKYRLLWLTDANVTTVTTSGTYRVNRFDGTDGTGIRALKVRRDATRNYWIGLRKSTGESLMSNSAYVIWGYNSPQQSNLLDTQTPGNSAADAGLPVGKTLSDATEQISITTVDQGGATGSEYLDVSIAFSSYGINLSAFPANGGTQTGGGAQAPGSTTTVTASANNGFVFSGWSESGSIVSTTPVYTFTLSAPRTLVANYYPTTATTWIPTGGTNIPRSQHTATLLQNGQVLIVGGVTGGFLTLTDEVYNPTLEGWSLAADTTPYFFGQTASLLASGKVLAAGTSSGSGNTAQLYDPGSGAWTNTGTLVSGRYGHTATVLTNGQVLAAGGYAGSAEQANAELYDPTSGRWSATGSLLTSRTQHSATLLASGQVLISGGSGGSQNFLLKTAELYNPVAKTFSATGSTANYYYGHTTTLLANGQVLIVGGSYSPTDAELYDPVAKTWSATGSLNVGRAHHTATLLPNGKVLVAGGDNASVSALSSAELYDPVAKTWSVVPSLNAARTYATATLLSNGQVLVVGGNDATGAQMTSAELFLDLTTQTLANFPATLNLLQSASPYSLTGTTSAGLAPTYAVVSGPALVSGDTLTLTGSGTVVLAATQAGNNVYAGLAATETITVTGSGPAMAFTQWEAQAGFFTAAQLMNANVSGLGAVPENDGVSNLEKYLCNIDPARPMTAADRAALPDFTMDTTTTPGTTYLALTYRQYFAMTNLVVAVQTSPDLTNWTTVTPDLARQVGTDPVTSDPIREVEVKMTGSRLFIRLRLTSS